LILFYNALVVKFIIKEELKNVTICLPLFISKHETIQNVYDKQGLKKMKNIQKGRSRLFEPYVRSSQVHLEVAVSFTASI